MTLIWRKAISQTQRSSMSQAIVLAQSTTTPRRPRNYNTLGLATLPSVCLERFSTNMRSSNNNAVVQKRLLSNIPIGERVVVSQTTNASEQELLTKDKDDTKIRINACGNDDDDDAYDSEEEQEEMFVDPHESLGHSQREWGGPRRGGRLAEPTRFGDWERKGRCTDF
mmetsp:Transcript_6901/g.9014  ORF Transcript_6901/g.9014 Transcript_6901/m.9014 type:complete len:168 (-) Transcript_6901:165-668(-)|eukprot:CAMPEP_0195290472 /NCGR_PEP_ID=MMETSP0707-20130614/6321_1 /TAXON_ID=33640 /ORGANISM="Asterionellopsis glacialis, Strain CCMP134" /LENGTH=167 /DNA_ID=CAMNT_0040350603 /DNA_START=18 /DNA_END=521 /DNA_ORIENTATION=-